MYLRKKRLNILNDLVTGIAITTLGIIVVIGSINLYTWVINLLVYTFIILGISQLINFLLNKKIVRNKQVLFRIIINIVLGLIFLLFPKLPISLIPIVFSIYLLFNAIVKFINYSILAEVNLKSRFKELLFGIIFLIFSFIFLFYPTHKISIFVTIIGAYCIILGINKLYQFVIDILSDKLKLKLKKKLRMTLPIFFEAFVPKRALKYINKYLDELIIETKNKNKDSDIQIFIHLSPYGFNQFGHMDIMFEGKIYSYGNYDKNSRSLFNILGDGVLFEVNKKIKYINFCINTNKKTILEYGIKLTDNQKERLKKELNSILKDAVIWKPEKCKDGKKIDYANRLYNATHAKFYKFTKGTYKKYFALGVNCTYFVDMLMRNYVFEVLKIVGIISPGTYYEYLEENYRKINSNVVSKVIYNKESIGEEYVKNKK